MFFKIWSVGIQYTVFHIVAPCSAHSKECVSLQFKHLSPHQMDHMRADALDFPTVPFLDRVFPQQIKVLVIAADKQHGEG